MHEYELKYPLEVLDNHLYTNLRRDRSGMVVSDNITAFLLREITRDEAKEVFNRVLSEMEFKVKEYCPNAELAYSDTSGNRWLFLLFNGKPSKDELKQMQRAYREIYDPTFKRWREDYQKQISAL